MTGICGRKFWGRNVVLGLSLIAGCSAVAPAANTIKGVVHNQTHGGVAVGVEVILLRFEQPGQRQPSLTNLNPSMQEEARTNTDSEGLFTLDVRYPNKLHLVRVVRQGVNYDQRASAGDAVSIDVFDAVSKVQNVAGSIEIIRIGTVGNHLHISDMIEIKNDSSPRLTQAGERTFEVCLPAGARIDSVLAAGPEQIATLIHAAPVPGEAGHYAVNFPLRPGATKFAFNYDLPYDGLAAFRPKNMYPMQQLAVMIPPTMKFTSRSAAFHVLSTGNDRYRVEAANVVKAGDGPGFEISGVGALPALRAQAQVSPKLPAAAEPTPALSTPASSQVRTRGANDLHTAAASGTFAPSSHAQSRVQWWVLGVGVVTLGTCGFLLWRRQRPSGDAMTKAVQKTEQKTERHEEAPAALVEALQGELHQLEIDRSLGTIAGEEYTSAKQALEGTVKRVLARARAA